jgi:flagellar biosynthesis chaperone FliJ
MPTKTALVVDFGTKTPIFTKILVSRQIYMETAECIEQFIKALRPLRKNQKNLDDALKIIVEMKWNAYSNHRFRQETYHELEELSDEIYIELATEWSKV